MTYPNPARLGVTAILLCTISTVAVAQTGGDTTKEIKLSPIYIEGNAAKSAIGTATGAITTNGTTTTVETGAMSVAPALDGGALLSTIPGISGARMGGHGIDIVLHGMMKNQLNVIDAGSFTFGGCPSRMDPPSSIAAIYRAGKIVVEEGYSSVTNGPGAPGGTVIFEREAPTFPVGKKVSGHLTFGGTTNGAARESAGDIAFDLGHGFYLQAAGEYKRAGDYKDGSGNTVRSSYKQQSTGLTLGYKKNGVDLAFDIDRDKARDVEFAGASMDSPLSKTSTYRLRGGVDLDGAVLTRIQGVIYRSDVHHRMDNYTLRTPSGMAMLSPTTSNTWGGKLEAKLNFGRTKATIGIDNVTNDRTAYGYMAMSPAMINLSNPSSLTWPGIRIADTGLFAQTETDLAKGNTLRLGLRLDHVRASAALANQQVGTSGKTPNDYYQQVYGTTFSKARTENNVSGLIRLEHDFGTDTKGFIGISHVVRTADADERGMARGMNGMAMWVGNPDIKPEKHNQIALGIQSARGGWSFGANAFYDRVGDFILQDSRSVTMMGSTTTQTYYRNVGATLTGVSARGSWTRGKLTLAGDLSYTYGQNRSDDAPLAQIPPLAGHLSATWKTKKWDMGGRVNWAASQTRFDPNIDPGPSTGYATLDLFGSYALTDKARVVAGANNLFNKTYATFLGRQSIYDPLVTRVNEPGRTLYVSFQMTF